MARLGGDEFAILLTGLPAPAMAGAPRRDHAGRARTGHRVDGMRLPWRRPAASPWPPAAAASRSCCAARTWRCTRRNGAVGAIATYTPARGHRGRRPADARRRPAPGGREARVHRRLPADRGSRHRRDHLRRGAGPVAPSGPRRPDPDAVPRRRRTVRAARRRSPTRCSIRRCAAFGTWRDAGFDLPVAVNVSPRSLLDPRSRAVLGPARRPRPAGRPAGDRADRDADAEPARSGRPGAAASCATPGVRLALDDFGTGVSRWRCWPGCRCTN